MPLAIMLMLQFPIQFRYKIMRRCPSKSPESWEYRLPIPAQQITTKSSNFKQHMFIINYIDQESGSGLAECFAPGSITGCNKTVDWNIVISRPDWQRSISRLLWLLLRLNSSWAIGLGGWGWGGELSSLLTIAQRLLSLPYQANMETCFLKLCKLERWQSLRQKL